MDANEGVARFVHIYNEPGSIVYPLYASRLEWSEHPGGRTGGRAELFAALALSRERWSAKLEVASVKVLGECAVLNSRWIAESKNSEQPHTRDASLLWVFRFDGDGLIVAQHDYLFERTDL